jgi:hypothetical protein
MAVRAGTPTTGSFISKITYQRVTEEEEEEEEKKRGGEGRGKES